MTTIGVMEAGAWVREVAGRVVVTSYGNEVAARLAFQEGAALVNRSHWGLLRLTGNTRQNFLHNQTTSDFKRLKAGEGQEAVFVTATARVIDLVTALATEEATWLIVSPERRAVLMDWMPRFVFFNDDVQFHEMGEQVALFSLLGPTSGTLLAEAGAAEVIGLPVGHHRVVTLAGVEGVRVAVGGGLVGEGYTLLVPAAGAESVWAALRGAGAEPMGADLWESLRIEQGRPAAERELTEEHNPLEAGLWAAVSFAKGCYIGQEIIARLDTYQKLKQQVWGLRPVAMVEPGMPVRAEGAEIGIVTSATQTPLGPFALAYLRGKGRGAGQTVQVGETSAEVVDLPFLTRGRQDG